MNHIDILIPPQNSTLPNINRASIQSSVQASEPCFDDFKLNRKTKKDADEAIDQIENKEGDYILSFLEISNQLCIIFYQFAFIIIIQH